MSPDPILAHLFRGLVARVGGVDAATAILEEAYGAASKGTVSKMTSGQAHVTLAAAQALEDALGLYPITVRLFERISARPGPALDLRAMTARLARDSGCAVSSLVMAFSGASTDPERLTEEERADVNARARALRDDCLAVIAATEAMNEPATTGPRLVGDVDIPHVAARGRE